MADIVQVGDSLVELIATAIYPNGTSNPSTIGEPVKVYQGWPNPNALEADLLAGIMNVSVFPKPSKSIDMFDGRWKVLTETPPVMYREIGRDIAQFQVTTWANCYGKREKLAPIVGAILRSTSNIELIDHTKATIAYNNSIQDDGHQKQGVYRRDIFVSVEYPTIETEEAYTVEHIEVVGFADAYNQTTPLPKIG